MERTHTQGWKSGGPEEAEGPPEAPHHKEAAWQDMPRPSAVLWVRYLSERETRMWLATSLHASAALASRCPPPHRSKYLWAGVRPALDVQFPFSVVPVAARHTMAASLAPAMLSPVVLSGDPAATL